MESVVICGFIILVVVIIAAISMLVSMNKARESAEELCRETVKLSTDLAFMDGYITELKHQIIDLTKELNNLKDDLETMENDN